MGDRNDETSLARDGIVTAGSTPAKTRRRAGEHNFAVYIAGSSSHWQSDRVQAAIAALRAHDIVVTNTWTEVIVKVGDANPRAASDIDRRGWAVQCLNEIDAADAVWVLVPVVPATTRGAWFEAGYAYSNHKHVVFSGDTKQSVFCALGREFATDAAAIAYLRELRDRARVEAGLSELRDAPAMGLRLKNELVAKEGDGRDA